MINPFRFFATGRDKPVIEDQQTVDKLYRRYRLSVMMAITVGYGFAYTCRLVLAVVKKPLIDEGIFSATELGIIGAALFWAYGLGKFTNGFLADHVNIKRFFAIGVLLSALMNLAMGWSGVLIIWIILWSLNGWFQGFGAPTGAVALANWFSNHERGRYYGIWSTGQNQGEALTYTGVIALISIFGWQAGFWGPGIFCIFVAIAIFIFLKDRPQTLGLPSVADWKNDHGVPETDSDGQPLKTGKAQLHIFKLPTIWVLGLASATMYMTRYGINMSGILYLQETEGYSLFKAGILLTIASTVGIAGSVAYGFISDLLFKARRPPLTLIFGIIEVLALILIFFGSSGHPILLIIAFAIYGFTLNGLLAVLGGLFAIDIAPKKAAGAAMGFIGIFSYIGAGLQEMISGILIDKGTTIVDGVRHYDFSSAISFWIGASVVSMILAATLWKVKVSD
ncbi:MAG: MFS transporter [Candidatus Marinimicrobia bacterium]|nr:MFS transporter [Candidatus Neomarinimicrobiota bacterium]